MDNPRDWSGALWLIARQAVIIVLCLAVVIGFCAVMCRAILTG